VKIINSIALFFLFSLAMPGFAVADLKPLFHNGAEVFKIQNNAGKTPQFRVLDDTPTEKALALGVITALNTQADVQPKIPMTDYIDLKFESMKLIPSKKQAKDILLSIRLSGYELELEKIISRVDFLAGKLIEIPFPTGKRQVAVFDVSSRGSLKMRLDPKTNVIILENVAADMDFEAPVMGGGSESVRFSGKGIRESK